MKNLRAFKITTLQATDTKPVRLKITDLRFDKSVIIGYSAGSASDANGRVREYLKENGIEITFQAWHEINGNQHSYTLLLTDNFTTNIK